MLGVGQICRKHFGCWVWTRPTDGDDKNENEGKKECGGRFV